MAIILSTSHLKKCHRRSAQQTIHFLKHYAGTICIWSLAQLICFFQSCSIFDKFWFNWTKLNVIESKLNGNWIELDGNRRQITRDRFRASGPNRSFIFRLHSISFLFPINSIDIEQDWKKQMRLSRRGVNILSYSYLSHVLRARY